MNNRAFTLIELLVTIAIIGVLFAMASPALQRIYDVADETKCANNLRQLAVVIQAAAQDNDNHFPRIENDPSNPIHTDEDGEEVMTLAQLCESHRVSTNVLKCPADVRLAGTATGRSKSYFDWLGSSYEWLPFFEGELTTNPTIRGPFGQFSVPLSRVRLVLDYAENSEGPHRRGKGSSSINALYGDGHVSQIELNVDGE